MRAHREAMEQSEQRILSMLGKVKRPLKTGVGAQAVANYIARRMIKKTA